MARLFKVMRIIARLNVGGPAIQAITLTSRLSPGSFTTTLVTGVPAPHEGNMDALAEAEGVTPVVLPSLGREISLTRDFATYRELVALMREEQPDIVHTHTAKAGFLGRMAAHKAGVPAIVHTFHGNVLKGYFSERKTALYRWLEQRVAKYTDRIIAISPTQRKELLELGVADEEKIVVIPLGFDLERFVPSAESEAARMAVRKELLGVPDDMVVVTIVARLTAIKRIDRALRVAQRVLREVSDVVFLVIGDGEERPALEALARELHIEDQVRFHGWRQDMPGLYHASDVVLLTSDNEGTPVTLIEAMAAAVPVVSTRVGGVADFVTDGSSGMTVELGDEQAAVDGLAAKLIILVVDRTMRVRVGEAGRRAVMSTYSFERLREDIERLYFELAIEKDIVT